MKSKYSPLLKTFKQKSKINIKSWIKDTNKAKELEYKDCAILIDRSSKFELYKKNIRIPKHPNNHIP